MSSCPAGPEEARLWSAIREQLRQLDVLRDEIKPLEEEYEQLQGWPGEAVSHRSLEEVSRELHPRLRRAHRLSDNTYEKVSILQALLTPSTTEDVPLRKVRRVETSPVARGSVISRLASSASSVPASHGPGKSSDTSTLHGKGLHKRLATTPSSAGVLASSSPPTASASAPIAGSAHDATRVRREQYEAQLPLNPGRRVAFRPPSGRGEPGPRDNCEGWIMATVVGCIGNDRNRYVVRDDDADTNRTYNTTLKAIVPLPESGSTLPPRDYMPGQQVLAVYPDTTTFYIATVMGGGPGRRGAKRTNRSEPELLNSTYQLLFDDDEGIIRSVNVTLVLERPRA